MPGGGAIREPTLFTIGHGSRKLDAFLRLLAAHNIRTVIDVRSRPHSHRAPQYSKAALAEELTTAGISYRWLGDHLGGLPLRDGEDPPVATPELLDAGVTEASALAEGATTVLLCSEAEPTHCHRLSVLAAHFEDAGFTVTHIRPDGSLQPHQPSFELN